MSDIEKYQSLCSANPENALYRFSLGKSLFDAGRYPDAIKAFEFCLNAREDWMVVWILMGRALLSGGKAAEAETHLKKALQLAIEQQHEDPEQEIRSLLDSL